MTTHLELSLTVNSRISVCLDSTTRDIHQPLLGWNLLTRRELHYNLKLNRTNTMLRLPYATRPR